MQELPKENIFAKFRWLQDSTGSYKLISMDEANKDVKTQTRSRSESKDLKEDNVIDNTKRFKENMSVMTEWGVGNITKLDAEMTKATIKIEGTELEFPLTAVRTELNIYCCILNKEGTQWAEVKLNFDATTLMIKKKIASLCNCHHSQVVLVHNGSKIKRNLTISELGLYEREILLCVIKDPIEHSIIRCSSYITSPRHAGINSIRCLFTDIVYMTGLGFLKNNCIAVYYDLFIYEENQTTYHLNLIYSEKRILVDPSIEGNVYKHTLPEIPLKKNTWYEFQQFLHSSDNNQVIGMKCIEEYTDNILDIQVKFANSKASKGHNCTDVNEGMIPAFYFCMKNE